MTKPSFATAFSKSIQDVKTGQCDALLCLVPHPSHIFIRNPNKDSGSNNNPFSTWCTDDIPWLGVSAWAHPSSLEKEMIAAGCGALFSHANVSDPKNDKVYCDLLGPFGAQIGGASWNPQAFSNHKFSKKLTIGTFDIRLGHRGILMKGQERPDHWPEPLPMAQRIWTHEDPRQLAPALNQVAQGMTQIIMKSITQAILEETDATPEQVQSILGASDIIPSQWGQHFFRQEHPMFGATAFSTEDFDQAQKALSMAQTIFEQSIIEHNIQNSAQTSPTPRL